MSHAHDRSRPPVIGIAPDITEPAPGRPRVEVRLAYSEAVLRAGGTPIVLAPIVQGLEHQLAQCDGIVLTGGDDPRTEAFGVPTHPKATPVHPLRQAFDLALLKALHERSQTPVLGVCLGMQMMALAAGGELDQHLPDHLTTHALHAANSQHRVQPIVENATVKIDGDVEVTSHHRQAVRHPGLLRVIALSEDGVIEAIDDPGRRFYLGVQWHPERSGPSALGDGVFSRLVRACLASGI